MTQDQDARVVITIDPHGSWRQNRFDFCNALETALDDKASPSKRDAAKAELERMGVIQRYAVKGDAR